MQRTREYEVLLQACQQEGCPLCRIAQESVRRYLDSWKYEKFTDVGVRQELRRSQGFCHQHTWELAHIGAGLQLAQAYRDILSDLTDQLQGPSQAIAQASGGLLRRIFDSSTPRREHAPCPACVQREKVEQNYVEALRKALLDNDFYKLFANSSGLCLEHFHQTNTGDSGEWQPLLRKAQVGCLRRLDEQLTELIRKHDYRFKDEVRGLEMLAWRRAAGLVAGEE